MRAPLLGRTQPLPPPPALISITPGFLSLPGPGHLPRQSRWPVPAGRRRPSKLSSPARSCCCFRRTGSVPGKRDEAAAASRPDNQGDWKARAERAWVPQGSVVMACSHSRLSTGGVLGAHGSAAVAMVEVGSLLTAVPGLGDLTKDDTLKQTYFYPARDPLACVLRSSAHCFPLPRLSPRPFSKEQGLDGRDPGPPRPGPAGVPKAALRGLDGRMPSLAGQEAGGGEATRASSPSPHKTSGLQQAVSAFESHSAGPMVGTGTGERCLAASAGVPHNPPCSSRPQLAAKPALPTRKLPGTLPWPAPLSPDARSVAPPQQEEAQARPLPKASSVEDQAGHAPGPRLRPKRRPVSAIFTEGLLPPGPGLGGKPPPDPPEKTWVRKPRPLSVDLTARFESREVLLRKAAIEGAGGEGWSTGGASPEPAAD
ncbi:uncharacterized protein KIAA1671-like, partial [Perognathus longimembris pacificus]|uniref:uncharacterized protein KIAA1671-like n=1 Tax=Perognathus longimembris pacificus TaxID=214514 RepID=UPI002019F66F